MRQSWPLCFPLPKVLLTGLMASFLLWDIPHLRQVMSDVIGETGSSCELKKHLRPSGLLLLWMMMKLCVCMIKSCIATPASLLPSTLVSWVWCPGLEKVATDALGACKSKSPKKRLLACFLCLSVISAHGARRESRPSTAYYLRLGIKMLFYR